MKEKTKTLLEEIANELDRAAQLRSTQERSAPLELGDIAAAIRRTIAAHESVPTLDPVQTTHARANMERNQ